MEDASGVPVSHQRRPISLVLSNQKPIVNSTGYYYRKNGEKFPVNFTLTPIVIGQTLIGAVEVFRDITREKEIDRAKSEFVSLASHQLRTPLGIGKWYLEALKDSGFLNNAAPVTKEYFEEVYKSNERLLNLVRDLLSVSRIDQGKVKDLPQLTDIPDLLKKVVKEMDILAAKSHITVDLSIESTDTPDIFIDPFRVQEVTENLITNAIQYSSSPDIVKVTLFQAKDEIFISVKDTGVGISKADQEKLFTKFFRAENAAMKNTEGSGLGLYVVKSYVEGWGGRVEVKSEEGKGSTFTISLPIKKT
jgi:signal transduction histidine kinase